MYRKNREQYRVETGGEQEDGIWREERENNKKKNPQRATPPLPPPPKLQRAAPTEALTGIVIDKQHQHCQNPTDTNPYVFVGECVIMMPRKTPSRERIPPPGPTKWEVTRGTPQPGAYLQRHRGQKTNNPERTQATPNHRQNLQT